MNSSRPSERGSAIFIVLIMIVIFAALSYAVSRDVRVGSGASNVVSEEKMRLAYMDLQNVVESHRIAIQKMVLSGISIDGIEVSASGPDGNYYPWGNSTCTSDACRLYRPAGGGLTFFKFGKIYPNLTDMPNVVDGNPNLPVAVLWTWVAYKGSTAPDMVYYVRVNRDFCVYINKQIGIDSTNLDTDTTSVGFFQVRDGTRQSLGTVDHQWAFTTPGQAGLLSNRREGCASRGSEYRYFSLLYAT